MEQHPAVQRGYDYLDTYASGDRDRLGEFFADDIVWRVGGYHRLSGAYQGRDAVFEYFDRVAEETGGTLTLEPEAVLASDRFVTMYTRVKADREGRDLDVTLAQAFRIGEDGRYTEYWGLADDQTAVDEFWGE